MISRVAAFIPRLSFSRALSRSALLSPIAYISGASNSKSTSTSIPVAHGSASPSSSSSYLRSPLRFFGSSHLVCMSGKKEVEAAAAAAASGALRNDAPTIFDKIVSKEIPATVIYEDDTCLAFRDVNPQAPVHFLVIPKNKQGLNMLSDMTEAHEKMVGHLMYVSQLVAKQEGLGDGFRVVVNNGKHGCQSVAHVHLHVMGGRQLGWPPC